MTSMFDQYERVSLKKSSVSKADKSRMDFYDPSPLESETPIFSKSKMEFSPPKQVTHVCICNKYMVVAMVNRMLFRMNLSHPQQKDEITIPKTINGKLTNIFLDPPGNHLLAAFGNELNPELLYLSRRGTKLKVTSKFKSYEITEVAWNPDYESEATTGQILLGTSKGSIVETEIISESEQNVRKVFDIGKGTSSPITGMYFFKNHNKYFIFVAIPNRLYYFTGLARTDEKSLFQQIFNCYLNIPEPDTYIEVESKLPYSKLQFWSENLTQPNSFAWMTEEGITFGEINSTNEDNIAALKCGLKQVKYPSSTNSPANFFVLTQFHALLGYPDSIKAICLLNNEIVYEDNYNEAFGKLISVIKDPMTGDVWAVTENALFHFKVKCEDRNVWYIYYESGELELAKKYAGNNEYHRNQILTKEADLLFEKKEYELSALRYAETQSSFEEICLKFIDANQVEALKVFLENKLQKLQPQDKTQITMIVLWIVELYLNKLEGMRLRGLEKTASYADVQKDFESFLCQRSVSDCVGKNRQTVFNLMASHGDKYNLMKFTIINKDFEMLIKQHIYKNNFLEALEVLKGQSNRELFYQFSPILMQKVPKYTIKALIEQESYLKPVKLLPALVCCDDEEHSMEVMKYLEFCINRLKTTEKAIHNLLISLYAKYDPEKLMKYLDSQGRQLLLVNYDVYFALRLCREKKLTEACVKLSSLLGLWESAVDLALEISVDLAKQIANMPPQNDIEMRKKLWLKIAQRVVSGKDDIQEAMGFLKECDLIRIEDVLPFFSDFVTIDHFKEAICDSLKEYNQHIQDLKEDMEEATRSAELVRKEIQSFRNRFTYLTTLDCCDICSFTLMVRGFYVFPCKHRFHTDCLLKELLPLLGSAKRNKLEDLERQLKVMNDQNHVDNVSTGSSGISARDILKTQIDNIIAAECLYCGENMIRNIDKPFIDENDYEKILKEWE